jgi:hypothetical protein
MSGAKMWVRSVDLQKKSLERHPTSATSTITKKNIPIRGILLCHVYGLVAFVGRQCKKIGDFSE